MDAWQWFAAPPADNSYAYVQSLLRIGMARHFIAGTGNWSSRSPAVLDAPDNAISPVHNQGQLGLGANYYAANSKNSYPAAVSLSRVFCALMAIKAAGVSAALNSWPVKKQSLKIRLSPGCRPTAWGID